MENQVNFELTVDQLGEMVPSNKDPEALLEALLEVCPRYEIDTEDRLAAFVAQCGHESRDFTALKENLNYSGDALCRVWPRHFDQENKDYYHRNPERIANRAYRDRMGNGSEESGDGWRYRGRGAIQLTGCNNYTAFGKTVDMTAEEAAEYVATPKGAVESACWFWNTAKLNAIADAGDIVKMTKKINGGTIGLEDRTERWEKALAILGGEVSEAPAASSGVDMSAVLNVGSTGDTVKAVQEFLGIGADGIFGRGTKRAIKQWQAANGLTADGVVGPATLKKMFG